MVSPENNYCPAPVPVDRKICSICSLLFLSVVSKYCNFFPRFAKSPFRSSISPLSLFWTLPAGARTNLCMSSILAYLLRRRFNLYVVYELDSEGITCHGFWLEEEKQTFYQRLRRRECRREDSWLLPQSIPTYDSLAFWPLFAPWQCPIAVERRRL